MGTPVPKEPMLGYHPCGIGLLTCRREPAGGQCQAGSLTGAVASERVSEAPKGALRMDGNLSLIHISPDKREVGGSSPLKPIGLVIISQSILYLENCIHEI